MSWLSREKDQLQRNGPIVPCNRIWTNNLIAAGMLFERVEIDGRNRSCHCMKRAYFHFPLNGLHQRWPYFNGLGLLECQSPVSGRRILKLRVVHNVEKILETV
jgi:hypothetical protein